MRVKVSSSNKKAIHLNLIARDRGTTTQYALFWPVWAVTDPLNPLFLVYIHRVRVMYLRLHLSLRRNMSQHDCVSLEQRASRS